MPLLCLSVLHMPSNIGTAGRQASGDKIDWPSRNTICTIIYNPRPMLRLQHPSGGVSNIRRMRISASERGFLPPSILIAQVIADKLSRVTAHNRLMSWSSLTENEYQPPCGDAMHVPPARPSYSCRRTVAIA